MSDLRHQCAITMTCCGFSVIGSKRPSSQTLGLSVMPGRFLNTQLRLCRGGSFEGPSLPYTSTERSSASMRQPTRPFITAYKGRSPKSRTSNPWKINEPENASGSPSLNGSSASAAPEVERDASYLAALNAADAVFGAKAAERPQILLAIDRPAGARAPEPIAGRRHKRSSGARRVNSHASCASAGQSCKRLFLRNPKR